MENIAIVGAGFVGSLLPMYLVRAGFTDATVGEVEET